MSHICIRTHKSFFFIRLEFYKGISEMLRIKERLSLKDPQKMMSPTAWDPSIPHPTHLIFLFFFGTRPSLSLSLSLLSVAKLPKGETRGPFLPIDRWGPKQ